MSALSPSHCGSILTFMMKIWRDTRERHRVKFLSPPLDDVKGNAFCVADVYAPCQGPSLGIPSIGPENINLCPQSAGCPLSAYHQV